MPGTVAIRRSPEAVSNSFQGCFGRSKEGRTPRKVSGRVGRSNACHLEAPRRGLIHVGGLVVSGGVDGPAPRRAALLKKRGNRRTMIGNRIGPAPSGGGLPLLTWGNPNFDFA